MSSKRGIRRKIILFIILPMLFVLATGFSLSYFFSFSLLKNTIGRDYQKIADTLATNVKQRINEEILCLEGLILSNKDYQEVLRQSNARYQKMAVVNIHDFMISTNKKWFSATKDSPLVKKYLLTNYSQELKHECEKNKRILELTLSDKFGGLAAASGTPHDFYQANKAWWQSAFAKGKGAIFVGDLKFDESRNTLGITFAFPIKDNSGSVIGIVKAVVDMQLLFSFLMDFSMGRTGHAALVNEKGYVILNKGIKPLSKQFFSYKELQEIVIGKVSGIFFDRSNLNPEKIFGAFAEVQHPLFSSKGMVWWVFVSEDTKEAFWPLYLLMFQLIGLIVFLIVLVVALGFIFGGKLAFPIEQLNKACDRITKGETDYPIKIKTGNELEEMAHSLQVISSSKKEINELLIRQKIFSDSIVASMADALIVIDPSVKIKSVNQAALDLLGYKEDELIGQHLKKIFPEEEKKGLLNKYLKKIITERVAYNISFIFITKEGKEIPVNLSSALMREGKRITGIVAVARDMRQILAVISNLERKEAELKERINDSMRMQRAMLHMMDDLLISKKNTEKAVKELKKLDQLKTDFISTVSHELRTPLSITKEGISLVLDKVTGEINEKQEDMLITARNNIDRLARIINDLLDVSKIEAGKIELKRELLNIVALIKHIAASFELKFKEKNLELRVNVPEKEIEAFVDSDKITQVFTNLIGNALKFTDSGYIEISLQEKKENKIEFIVADTGLGISEEDLPKVFSKFEQFGRVPGPGEKGTGLGLSITKGIIELHGGRIWVESPAWPDRPEGSKGTKFTFFIPKCLDGEPLNPLKGT